MLQHSNNLLNFNARSVKLLRILRVLRLMRLLRVVRVLHLITELRTIVSSIAGSFKSLGWTVVLLCLLIYIVAIFFTETTTAHVQEIRLANITAPYSPELISLRKHFGSLSLAALSLFQAMSG